MPDALREFLIPYYLYIKFIHLIAVMIWGWSTAVAYAWYVRASFLKSKRNPEDMELKRRSDWALEQFDRGAVLEHLAFPTVLVTGLLLFFVGGWSLSHRWLFWKLSIVLVVFVPMEILDIWLSHFGGNKHKIRKTGDLEKYEGMIRFHWRFFGFVTPLVYIFIPVIIFLAVVRP